MHPSGGAGRREAGFTLIEVLVAFVIAALALTALVRGAGSGLAATKVAAQMQDATSRARSRLAALSAEPLQSGEQSGTEPGGFRWRTEVRPAAVAARRPGLPADRRPALYALTATVSWGETGAGRQVTLSTQRLGTAPPEPP